MINLNNMPMSVLRFMEIVTAVGVVTGIAVIWMSIKER